MIRKRKKIDHGKITVLVDTKHAFVATNAKQLRRWKKRGNTYYPDGIIDL